VMYPDIHHLTALLATPAFFDFLRKSNEK